MTHRSPLILGLLLTATLCADAVAIVSLTRGNGRIGSIDALNAWSGLILAQVSVVSIWLVFRPRHDVWSWILPPAVLLAAAVMRSKVAIFGGGWTISDYFFRTALQMLISIVLLWLLMRTALWRKLAHDSTHRKWEFSLLQLFFWMTVTAAMSALFARSTWSDGQSIALTRTIGMFCPSAIALGVVLIATTAIHWLVRLAGYLIVGATVAMTLSYFWNWTIPDLLLVEFVLETLIVAAWVEWGGIVACRSNDALAVP